MRQKENKAPESVTPRKRLGLGDMSLVEVRFKRADIETADDCDVIQHVVSTFPCYFFSPPICKSCGLF